MTREADLFAFHVLFPKRERVFHRGTSCEVFDEWKKNRLVKSCTLEPGGLFTTNDFEEGVQTLDTAITEMSVIKIH